MNLRIVISLLFLIMWVLMLPRYCAGGDGILKLYVCTELEYLIRGTKP